MCVSRLAYRKGTELLCRVIPLVCAALPEVDFVVGGDGPKRPLLLKVQQAVGAHRLELLGGVPHDQVSLALLLMINFFSTQKNITDE